MKKLNVFLFFLFCSVALWSQDRISLFIGRANQYAAVDLSDYCKRLSIEYNVGGGLLHDYYRHCGSDWGNVGFALEIARTSGRSMADVCNYYRRHRNDGWGRVLLEFGIRPGTPYYSRFYDRIDHNSRCWNDHYHTYCKKHPKDNGKHKGHYKHGKKHGKKH